MSVSKAASTAANSPYPKSIFLIMTTEFCERFLFCGLRTILSLYLRNILLFGECKATVIYHVFIMFCYFFPIIGAVLADSFFGRFRTILYFGMIYVCGSILLSLSAVPLFTTEAIFVSMFGLFLIAIGTGGIKPCVAAFGGDQFRLPQQQQLLEQFFSIYYFTINFGGLVGMLITPVLRTTVRCFNNDSCYALGFGFPAGLMVIALVNSNIKLKSHWLDYAADKYEVKLINDMKTVLAILFIYIPLPLFWSLNDQQGSRWTFQASRTNGRLLGIPILPDQVQVINPAIVLLLIPFMEKTVYPCLAQEQILTNPLQRMVMGGFISASSFVASGILELKLEETYPILPSANESHINFVNILPCSIQLVNPFNNFQVIKAETNYLFKKVPSYNGTTYHVDILAPYECGRLSLDSPWRKIKFDTIEYQVKTIFIYEFDSKIVVSTARSENLQKSLSGKPKFRIVLIRDKNSTGVIDVQLKNYCGIIITESFQESEISTSSDWEIESGVYQYSISNRGKKQTNGTVQLDAGGVYSLVIHQNNNKITFVKLFMMTPPNTIHMLWLLPQYFLISVGEAIFAIAGLQFTFTQAPKCMKTVTLAAWYLSMALGNLLVIIITQLHLFKSQANEFFFFAFLAFLDMIVFFIMTKTYKFVLIENDDSTTASFATTDESPLIYKLQSSSDSFERESEQ
ncbi:solute carrier family 15 member 1-like [Lycorma delicatula]|uniref:solute carrier family 15 member 1-like n=1 Tax=Lycorma delicatula TaxID=130591 RepID=UPI003F511E18